MNTFFLFLQDKFLRKIILITREIHIKHKFHSFKRLREFSLASFLYMMLLSDEIRMHMVALKIRFPIRSYPFFPIDSTMLRNLSFLQS